MLNLFQDSEVTRHSSRLVNFHNADKNPKQVYKGESRVKTINGIQHRNACKDDSKALMAGKIGEGFVLSLYSLHKRKFRCRRAAIVYQCGLSPLCTEQYFLLERTV